MRSGLAPCVVPVDLQRSVFYAVDFWGLRRGLGVPLPERNDVLTLEGQGMVSEFLFH